MDASPAIHSLNGKLLNEAEVSISHRDLGFLRGYGVFDFLITYQNKNPFHLLDHVERLFHSADLIGLSLKEPPQTICSWTLDALQANVGGGERSIRIVATGGISQDSLSLPASPTILIMIDPQRRNPEHLYSQGAKIASHHFRRYIPGAKTTNYIEAVRELSKKRGEGVVEILYYDDHQVYEGATSNVFAVLDGEITTPKSTILPGITRKVLCDYLFAGRIRERDLSFKELLQAQEVFITASNKEVMPVVQIDNQIIGNGAVGSVTKEVIAEFKRYTNSAAWLYKPPEPLT